MIYYQRGSYEKSSRNQTGFLPASRDRSGPVSRPDPVPCLLLAQLAIDQGWTGKGVGTGLLKHALLRCCAAAEPIGGRALVVKAVDSEAASFWQRRGFLPSKDDPFVLFRSLADIAASVAEANG